jgi:hypothetical protein
MLRSRQGQIDASMETQLDRLAEALLGPAAPAAESPRVQS